MSPNVLLIGAPRSGTTFLFSVLAMHPDIFAPNVKEPHFHLADKWPLGGPEHETFTIPLSEYLAGQRSEVWGGLMTDAADYAALYADAGNTRWRLEATPNYFAEGAWMAERLNEHLEPDARVIVVLRDPIARTVSHYNHFVKLGWETRALADALAATEERLAAGWAPTWDYLKYSAYAKPLAEWQTVFHDRLRVVSFKDMTWQPQAVVQDLHRWLGLTPSDNLGAANFNAAPAADQGSLQAARESVKLTGRLDLEQEEAIVAAAHDPRFAQPLVTIGMPVLNGAESIRESLESLLSQTFTNLRIVVCDNASTDDTACIVRDLAVQDPRIELRSFSERSDIRTSYERAFATAAGDYFMFAPCDDRWAPEFIARAVQQMQLNRHASVCCGRIEMLENGHRIGRSEGVHDIIGPAGRRWRDALVNTFDASRIYGLLRVSALPDLIPATAPEGWDHYVTAKLALRGDIITIDSTAMYRDRTSDDSYLGHIERQEPTFWKRVFYLRHVRRLFVQDQEFKTGNLGAQLTLLAYMLIYSYLPLKERPKLYERFRKTGRMLARWGRNISV